MIRLITSRGYQQRPAPSGSGVVIDAPSSPLDGSFHACEQSAQEAIEQEQLLRREAVDSDLASGGPLTQGLTLLALQLQQVGWQDLDMDVDVARGIVVFPGGQSLPIWDAHRMLDELVVHGAPRTCGGAIHAYQDRLLARMAT